MGREEPFLTSSALAGNLHFTKRGTFSRFLNKFHLNR